MANEDTSLNGARLWFAVATKIANDLRAERRDEITKVEEKYAAAIKLADDDVDAADALLKWGAAHKASMATGDEK